MWTLNDLCCCFLSYWKHSGLLGWNDHCTPRGPSGRTLGQLIIVCRKVLKVLWEWAPNIVVTVFSFIQTGVSWQGTRASCTLRDWLLFYASRRNKSTFACEPVVTLSDPNSPSQTMSQWLTDALINSTSINCAHIMYRMLFVCLLSTVCGQISLTGGINIIPISRYLPHFLSFLLCECAGGCRTPRGLCRWL